MGKVGGGFGKVVQDCRGMITCEMLPLGVLQKDQSEMDAYPLKPRLPYFLHWDCVVQDSSNCCALLKACLSDHGGLELACEVAEREQWLKCLHKVCMNTQLSF